MDEYMTKVLQGMAGKTIAEAGMLYEAGECIGMRITFTDGDMVQCVYEGTEEGVVVQEVEG